jgi:hypothetical protein
MSEPTIVQNGDESRCIAANIAKLPEWLVFGYNRRNAEAQAAFLLSLYRSSSGPWQKMSFASGRRDSFFS